MYVVCFALCVSVCSAPSRRYYITRSFVFDKVEKVEAVLERLKRLREADSATAEEEEEKMAADVAGGVSVLDEVKEPDQQKVGLLAFDSG